MNTAILDPSLVESVADAPDSRTEIEKDVDTSFGDGRPTPESRELDKIVALAGELTGAQSVRRVARFGAACETFLIKQMGKGFKQKEVVAAIEARVCATYGADLGRDVVRVLDSVRSWQLIGAASGVDQFKDMTDDAWSLFRSRSQVRALQPFVVPVNGGRGALRPASEAFVRGCLSSGLVGEPLIAAIADHRAELSADAEKKRKAGMSPAAVAAEEVRSLQAEKEAKLRKRDARTTLFAAGAVKDGLGLDKVLPDLVRLGLPAPPTEVAHGIAEILTAEAAAGLIDRLISLKATDALVAIATRLQKSESKIRELVKSKPNASAAG